MAFSQTGGWVLEFSKYISRTLTKDFLRMSNEVFKTIFTKNQRSLFVYTNINECSVIPSNNYIHPRSLTLTTIHILLKLTRKVTKKRSVSQTKKEYWKMNNNKQAISSLNGAVWFKYEFVIRFIWNLKKKCFFGWIVASVKVLNYL